MPQLNPERAEKLRARYEEELMSSCAGNTGKPKEVTFPDFVKYTEAKEAGTSTVSVSLLERDTQLFFQKNFGRYFMTKWTSMGMDTSMLQS